MKFRLDLDPPTATAQQKKIRIVRGHPMMYESSRYKTAKSMILNTLVYDSSEAALLDAYINNAIRVPANKICFVIDEAHQIVDARRYRTSALTSMMQLVTDLRSEGAAVIAMTGTPEKVLYLGFDQMIECTRINNDGRKIPDLRVSQYKIRYKIRYKTDRKISYVECIVQIAMENHSCAKKQYFMYRIYQDRKRSRLYLMIMVCV